MLHRALRRLSLLFGYDRCAAPPIPHDRDAVGRQFQLVGMVLMAEEIDFIVSSFHAKALPRDMQRLPEFVQLCRRFGLSPTRESWMKVVKPAFHSLAELRAIRRGHEAGLDFLIFRIGQIEIGECPRATELAGRRFSFESAPLVPLEECDRRDQCGCRFQMIMEPID